MSRIWKGKTAPLHSLITEPKFKTLWESRIQNSENWTQFNMNQPIFMVVQQKILIYCKTKAVAKSKRKLGKFGSFGWK